MPELHYKSAILHPNLHFCSAILYIFAFKRRFAAGLKAAGQRLIVAYGYWLICFARLIAIGDCWLMHF